MSIQDLLDAAKNEQRSGSGSTTTQPIDSSTGGVATLLKQAQAKAVTAPDNGDQTKTTVPNSVIDNAPVIDRIGEPKPAPTLMEKIDALPKTTISEAQPDNRPENTFLSRIGQAILPESLQQEFGIAANQRRDTVVPNAADRVAEQGTLMTLKEMTDNPDKIDPLVYLQRGIGFGHSNDPMGQVESLLKGYKTTVDTADLPEPVTAKQKIAQGIGSTLTMAIAQPLIEAGLGSLISMIPATARIAQGLQAASEASPWTVGYGLNVIKSGGIGAIFGLLTKNKDSVASNVLSTAGMFAGFSALAYPVQQFFKPILQQVGTMEINNPSVKNILTDPQVTQNPVSKTLWFKNPQDSTQILKVTANGIEYVPKSSRELVQAGVNAQNIPTLTSLDIQAFKVKPSLYESLSKWIKGDTSGIKDVPFTVKDNMPQTPEDVSAPNPIADHPQADTSSADVRKQIDTLTKKLSTMDQAKDPVGFSTTQNDLATAKAALNNFHNTSAQADVVIRDDNGSPTAHVSTVQYSNGKYAVRVIADTPSHGLTTDFTQSKLYPTQEAAVAAGKAQLVDWAKSNIASADEANKPVLQSIIDGGKGSIDKLQTSSESPVHQNSAPLKSDGDTLAPLAEVARKYDTVEEFAQNLTPKQYKDFLNSQITEATRGERVNSATGRKLGSTKRPYGDYLYAQDRDMFNNQLYNINKNIDVPSDLVDFYNNSVGKDTTHLSKMSERNNEVGSKKTEPSKPRPTEGNIAEKRANADQLAKEKAETLTKPKEENPTKSKDFTGTTAFIEKEVKPFIQSSGSGFIDSLRLIRNVFAPTTAVKSSHLDSIMEMLGERNKFDYVLDKTTQNITKMFDKMSQKDQVAFVDRYKTGAPQPSKELQAVADMMREIDTANWNEAIKYKPTLAWKENHYRVLWKVIPNSPEAAGEQAKSFKGMFRRPLSGTKGFAKQATLRDMSEGIKAGGVPYSYNPMVMFKMAQADMMKFITAERTFEKLQKQGSIVYVKMGGEVPEGKAKINDAIARVYLNPNIKVQEYYDKHVMDTLEKTAKDLGIDYKRQMKFKGEDKNGVSSGAMGFYRETASGEKSIRSKFGTPEAVIAHEIGHHLDSKYKLQDKFLSDPVIKTELRDLANLKIEGKDKSEVPADYLQYIQQGSEQIAAMLETYIHAPERFKEVAPKAFEKFRTVLALDPVAKKLLDLRPSMVFEAREGSVNAGGAVVGGEYYADEADARVINNYLSKDWIRSVALGKGLIWIKNSTTAIELGLSPFHAVFESVETMGSSIGLGIQKMFNQGLLGKNPKAFVSGLKDVLGAPTSPYSVSRLGGATLRSLSKPDFDKTPEGKWFNKAYPNAQQEITDLFNAGLVPHMDRDYQINSYRAFKDKVSEGNYIGATFRAAPALNEQIMKPLFNTYIPRLKWGTAMREYSNLLAEREADLASGKVGRGELARQTVNSVENRFGEMSFDNLFWNRTFKTAMQMMFRSVTWKMGNIKASGGAFYDQGKEFIDAFKEKRAPRLSAKMAWFLGMTIVTATISTIIQKMATGTYPSEPLDFVFPKIDKDGTRVTTPSYWKDILSLKRSSVKYVTNSLAGYISKIVDIWNNRDFYGNQVYEPRDPFYKQLAEMGAHFVPLPFAVSSAQNTVGKEKAYGYFGFAKAPSYIDRTDIQNEIFDLYDMRNGGGIKSPQETERSNVYKQFRQLVQAGDKAGAKDVLNQAIKEKIVTIGGARTLINSTISKQPVDVYMFSRLPKDDQAYLASKMTKDELTYFKVKSSIFPLKK